MFPLVNRSVTVNIEGADLTRAINTNQLLSNHQVPEGVVETHHLETKLS